jgi:hypothetical protein
LSLLTPAFSLPYPPTLLTIRLLRVENAPLPLYDFRHTVRGFGGRLEPRYIFGADALDQ